MPQLQFGAMIIGDEILSGKRQDKHLSALIRILAARGLKLAWAEYIGDNPEAITAAIARHRHPDTVLFSFGGIGSTPDDHTRQCAAAAHQQPLAIHPEGKIIVEGRFGAEAYPHRINMVNIPAHATLIPNPINQMPGFSVGQHHFVPGFPSMAWPMIEWVLDARYAEHFPAEKEVEFLFRVLHSREGDMIDVMQDFVARYPTLGFSSLPSFGDADTPPHVEFGISGPPQLAALAANELAAAFKAQQREVEAIRQR